ncbi:UNVERIFIED_CONTAM: putative splicing factor 3A subunit [Sesamum calycinum]|uniref:Splicing factor 3A subunit n=1 Tax=Sesamum calycinum TaxID=2727403 RepID=A0AAW2Q7N6_9LAMI
MLGALPILPLPAPPADGNLGPTPPAQVTEDSNDEKNLGTNDDQKKGNDKPSAAPASVATHTRTIGIIYPPPDIRNIVDKTAQFVAKNGPEFEKRIIANNEGNAKFNFLRPSDPYHAYYQHRLSEARAQNQSASQQQPINPAEAVPESTSTAPAADTSDASSKPDPAAQFRPVRKVLEPPEAEQYTVRLPEGITGEELDIIKLTAQFVARNGKSFLTGLTSRESTNPQFHFLRPTHSMFMFFTSLADAYSKVLMPPKGLTDKLRNSVADMTTVLERCLHRLEWERSQEQARQKAEDEIEQERLQMAMIDWHDFVVVETIDFADDEDEDLPPPMTLDEVIRRSKMSTMEEEDIIEPGKEVEMEMDEEEVQLVEEGMRAASLEENGDMKNNEAKATPEEQEPPMRIVKNWKRPEERIPAERDPTKYVEQKERMFAKIRETTLAADDEISRNIVGLARTRPDIFGTTEEEVSNAVKAEIEKKKDEQPKQVIWDGHTGSIGRTASQAMSQNTGGEDTNDAFNNDGRSLPGPAPPPPRPGMPSVRPLPPPPGLVLNIPRPPAVVQYSGATSGGIVAPPPPGPPVVNMIPSVRPPPPMPMMHGQPLMANRPPMPPSMPLSSPNIAVPPPPGSQFTPLGEEAPPPLPDEPEPKRQRIDDSMLIPEDQFLAQHSGPAIINISVPNVDEGNLKGQVLEIAVQSLSETVGSLKEKIAGEIQLPANKQKLSGKAGFLKDNLSLAYYNVAPGDSLSLSLRERGGRKR